MNKILHRNLVKFLINPKQVLLVALIFISGFSIGQGNYTPPTTPGSFMYGSASGTVGTPMTVSIITPAAGATYYTLGVGAILPTGLTLNSTTGTITGTPTAASSSSVMIQAYASPTATTVLATSNVMFSISGTTSPGAGGTYTGTTTPPVTTPTTLTYTAINGTTGMTYTSSPTPSAGLKQFSATTLPIGFSINVTTGVISGSSSVTLTGTTPYMVTAKDTTNNTITGSIMISITSSTGGTYSGTTPPPTNPSSFTYGSASGTVGTPMTVSITTPAAGATYYTLGVGAILPTGLTLNSTTGTITGTPTAASSSSVMIQAYTSPTATTVLATSNVMFSIVGGANNNTPSSFTYGSASGTVGTPMTVSITTPAAGASYYTLGVGAILPTGLVLNSTTGTITGTPTVASSSSVMIQAYASPTATTVLATSNVMFSIVGGANNNTPSSFTYGSASGTVGTPMTVSITTPAAGATYYTLGVGAILPTGLTLNSTTGTITGTPTAASSSSVMIQAYTSPTATTVLATASVMFSITSTTTPPVTTPTTLIYTSINGTTGTNYSSSPTPSTGLKQFSATALPAGFSINATTGVISGSSSVTLTGTTPYTVTAKDTTNNTITGSIMITITAGAGGTSTPTTPGTGGTYTGTTTPPTNTGGGTGMIATFNYTQGSLMNTVGKAYSANVDTKSLPTGVLSYAIDNTSTSTFTSIGGLSINATTGVVSGNPENVGMYNIKVNAIGANAAVLASSTLYLTFSLPTFSYNSMLQPKLGVAFSMLPIDSTLPAGVTGYLIQTDATNTLNSIGGVTFNTTTGAIAGTPLNTGNFPISVSAVNANNKVIASANAYLNINLTDFYYAYPGEVFIGTQTTIKTDKVPSNVVSFVLDTSGTRVLNQVGGLTFDPTTGYITGKPGKLGYYSFKVFGVDANAKNVASATTFLNITLPRFNYTYGGQTILGTTFSLQPVASSLPAGIVSYSLDTSAKIINGIGGVTFNTTTGVVSGKPEKTGMYNVQVLGLDASGNIAATSWLTINISLPNFYYSFNSESLVGVQYNSKAERYPTNVVSFAIDSSGVKTLKSTGGLTFSGTDGLITGKPTNVGYYNFQVYGLDATGKVVAMAYMNINITLPRIDYIASNNMPTGMATTGSNYSIKVVTQPTGVVKYAIDSASVSTFNSINALQLDATTGAISGIPTAIGYYYFKVNAYDANSKIIASGQNSLNVQFPSFDYNMTGPAIIDSNFSISVRVAPTKVKTYVIDSSYVANFNSSGLTLNALTGQITGKPKKLGNYYFKVNAFDDFSKLLAVSNVTVYVSLPMFYYENKGVVIVNNPITINPISKPANAVRYAIDSLSATMLSQIGGLSINANTGVISGTPLNTGGIGVMINAYDANSNKIAIGNSGVLVSLPMFKYNVNDTITNAQIGSVDSMLNITIKTKPTRTVRFAMDTLRTMSFSSNLTGLSLDPITGTISGKAITKATTPMYINAYDENSIPIGTSNFTLNITYPSFKYSAGYDRGVIDSAYSAKILNPIAGATSYAIDTLTLKSLTNIGGLVFNKTNGAITGVPKTNGFMYLIVNAYDANGKQIGISYLLVNIRKSSTISINSQVNKYVYNGLAQGPKSVIKNGSSGLVTLKYTNLADNNIQYNTLPNYVGDYQVEAILAEDSFYYSAMSAPFKFTIDKAPITIAAKPQLKAYGAAITTVANTSFDIVGTLVNNETITSVTLTPDSAAVNVKTAAGAIYKIVPSNAVGANGFNANNYNITYKAYEGIVSKIPLTVTATGPTKLVGSLLTSQVATSNFTASGMLTGETVTSVTLTPDAKGISDSTAAGSSYFVTPSLAKGDGGFLESNYAVTYVPYQGIVAKRNLVITAVGPTKTYGTALSAATSTTNFVFTGLGSGDKITELTLTPDVKGLSATTAVGQQYTITPSAAKGALGNLVDNYNITYVPYTGTVAKKSLSIIATGPNKNYGTALVAGSSTTNFNTTALAAGDVITEVTLTPNAAGLSSTTAAGTNYTVTPSLAKGSSSYVESNYDITYVPFTGTVAKVAATMNVTGNTTYAYTGTPQGPNSTNLTSGTIVYTYSGVSPTVYAPSSILPTEAGTYQVIAKLAENTNFYETISAPLTFTINKSNSVVTVTGSTTYVYNGKAQGPSTSTVVGSKENVVYTYSGVSPTVYAASTIAPKNVGTYKVVASVNADANYGAGVSAAYNFSITKAALKVTADNKSKTFGLPLPKLTLYYTGFGVGDDSSSLTTLPLVSTTATASSAVGSYPITVTGGASNNYTFEYVAGTLTIDLKIDPTISLTDAKTNSTPSAEGAIKVNSINSFIQVQRNMFTSSKVYGDKPFVLSASSNSTGTFTFRSHNTNVATISGNIVTIVGAGSALIEVIQDAGTSSTGTTDEFHTGNASATLIVNKATTTITPIGNASYTYSNMPVGPVAATVVGSTSPVTYTYTGTGTTNYATSATSPIQVGSYQAVASVIEDNNYNGAVSTPISFTIEKANSSIAVNGLTSYTYNGNAQGPNTSVVSGSSGAVTYSYSGTGTTTYNATSIMPTNAGTYQVIATVLGDANYNSAISTAYAFTITKANSTVFVVGDKEYTFKGIAQGPSNTTGLTGSTGIVTYKYTGIGTTNYATSTIAPSNAGTYQVVAELAADNNFNGVTSPAFAFNIIKSTVNINITGATSFAYTGSGQGPSTSNISGSTAIVYTYSGIGTTTYAASTTKPTNVGTYKVVATTSEDANQFGATSDAFEFAIIKSNSTVTVTGDNAYVYNGDAQGPQTYTYTGSRGLVTYTYSGVGSTNYDPSNNMPILVGTYKVVATLVSDQNYNGAVSTAFNFAITKANSTIAVIGDNSYVYNATAQGPANYTSTGSNGAVTYRYTGTGSTNYTASAIAPTKVGTYKVIATIAADDNFNGANSVAFDFSIVKATPIVSITPITTVSYNGKAQGPTVATALGTTAIPTISYSGVYFDGTTYGPTSIRPINAGSYQAIATVAADANYTSANSNVFEFTIGQAMLIVIADNAEKTHNYPNPTFTYKYDPNSYFVNGETESVLTTKPHVTSDATTNSDVSTYAIYFDQHGVANNYDFTYVEGSFEISERLTPEIKFADIAKTYGGAKFTLAGTSNSGGEISYTSDNEKVAIINGNEVTIVGAGIANITLIQAADVPNNYMQSTKTAILTVAKAPLTVTATSVTKVYGEDNPAVSVNYAGFVNGEDKTVLITLPTATHTVVNNTAAGVYGVNLTEGAADNYTFNYVNGVFTVNKALLTITAKPVSKIYGTALTSINASNNFISTATAIVGEAVTSVNLIANANAVSTTTAAGASYLITPSNATGTGGFDANNYTITYVPYTGTVSKKAMTITATAIAKTYGSALATINASSNFIATGQVTGESVTSVTLTPNDKAISATTAAGVEYTLTPSLAVGTNGFNASNYDISYVAYTGTVAKKALTATADNKSKTYGATNPAFTISYSGFVNGEDASAFTTAPQASTTATATSAVGSYDITLTAGNASNYAVTYNNGVMTINKAALTITAENKSKVYGAANPALTLTYSGFVNGETASTLLTAATVTTTATVASNVGTYNIVVTGATSNNYSITYTNGSLVVNKAILNVFTSDKNKIYGTANPSFIILYDGFVNGDNLNNLTTIPTATTTATTTSKAGKYDIVINSGAATNYTLVYTNSVLTIDKAILTVTAQNASRCYGAADPTLTYTITGFVGNETEAILSSKVKITTDAAANAAAGTYTIKASGAAADNYDFVYKDGSYVVNPLPTGKLVSSVDFVCDGSTLALTADGGAKYVWYKGGVEILNATTATLSANSAGVYSAKLVSAAGCEAMASNTLTIKLYTAPVASFSTDFYCINKPVYTINKSTITGSGTVKYTWDNGAGLISNSTNPTFTYTATGNKTIKLTVTPDNCPALASVATKVLAIEAPTPGITYPNQDIVAKEPIVLNVRNIAGAASYEWTPTLAFYDPRVANPMAIVDKQTTFNVKTTALSSCETVDTLTVRVFDGSDIFVPTVFSPNGDGINDKLVLNLVILKELQYFRVYDKYNNLVFETKDPLGTWDGTLHGTRLPVDTYFWVATGVDMNGKLVNRTGAILLAR